jgi:hypothetical protein
VKKSSALIFTVTLVSGLLSLGSHVALATEGSTGISPNMIPSECKSLALTYLIAGQGAYESPRVGARLWNIDKLERASGQGPAEKDCLAKAWVQANRDERDYWLYIGGKYHCLEEPQESSGVTLIKEPSQACPANQLEAVANNLRYLQTSFELRASASSGGRIGTVCNEESEGLLSATNTAFVRNVLQVAKTAQDQDLLAPEQKRSETFESGLTCQQILGSNAACGEAADAASCRLTALDEKGYLDESKLQPEYQSQEYRKTHPLQSWESNTVNGIAACGEAFVKNFLKSIWDDLKGLITGVWSGVKMVGNFAKGEAQLYYKIAKALFNGSLGTLARQEATDNKAMLKHLEEMGSKAYLALKTKLASEFDQFKCYNDKARSEKACAILGYVGPDILMLIPPFQEAAVGLLEKIPGMAKAIEATRIVASIPGKVARGLIGASVELTGDALAAFRKIAYTIPWVEDISSGLKVALVGGEVVARDAAGNIYKEFKPSYYRQLVNSLEKRYAPPINLAESGSAASDAVAEAKRTVGQKIWSKLSPAQKQAKALEANATRAGKEMAELPKGFEVDSELTEKTLEQSADKAAYRAAKEREAAQSAQLLDFKAAPAESNGIKQTNKYLTKDGNAFWRVQHDDGTWWYATENRLSTVSGKTAATTTQFPVYIEVAPEHIADSLPEVTKLAAKQGSRAIEIGGSSKTLQRGDRLAVYFNDPSDAKAFMDKIKAKSSLGVVRERTIAGTTLKITVRSVVTGAIAKCSTAHDNFCYCHYYYSAGINPVNDEPIETSPFRCSSDADAHNAMDAALKNYEEAHPKGSAPDSDEPKYIDHKF